MVGVRNRTIIDLLKKNGFYEIVFKDRAMPIIYVDGKRLINICWSMPKKEIIEVEVKITDDLSEFLYLQALPYTKKEWMDWVRKQNEEKSIGIRGKG